MEGAQTSGRVKKKRGRRKVGLEYLEHPPRLSCVALLCSADLGEVTVR